MMDKDAQGRAATLKVAHLEKMFGSSNVVDDVSFSLAGGQLLTLLGPSGSGKTTMMRMIAGIENPTSGSIHVGSESVIEQPVHKRNMGVVFQQYALFPHPSVLRNIAYPLEMRNVVKAEIGDRVRNTLEMVRLTGYENRLPRELSGGQQQRVGPVQSCSSRGSRSSEWSFPRSGWQSRGVRCSLSTYRRRTKRFIS
jgi:putative spermidine/putrescine transport system ATP-binding protein